MADPFTSALVTDVVGRLTSTAIQEYGLLRGVKNDLSALENTFKQIQGVLYDAEMKQTTQKDVEEWLRTLKSASLEAENVLDEAKTEAMIQRGSQYQTKKLEDIDANRSKFKLTPNITSKDDAGIGGEISNRETSSLVNLSKIYGRDAEKKMIVDKICNQGIGIRHDIDDVRVYAIWGMGGIGKTTLSSKFKQILKAIYGLEDLKLDEMPLDDLQKQLQSKLRGKKYFIIMDDVWIETKEMEKWDELCKALSCGAKGSMLCIYQKRSLWSLFKMLAFPGRGEGENVSELEPVGREIVNKCKGLPLAVKTMGSLMSTKKKVNEWRLVNDKFMSEMQDNGILTALRLSYDDLPPHMKICFAYCCVFSKGEEMSKDLLIELWMANGFIPSQEDVSLYVLGEEIFSCLVRRSFFQDVFEKDIYTGEICKMHDLMHDLAQYEMRHDCAVIGPGKELMTPDEVLHLSIKCEGFEFSKQDLRKLRSVRSMLVFNRNYTSNIRQMSNHVYLRVLHLNRIGSSTLPKSICKLLIHLRYLKISNSDIKVVPESIINLQNLQVLILKDCWDFRKLTKGLRYMRNLQRLDTGLCPHLEHMPVGIKELTNLRRLSQFAVGKDVGARIGELGNLNLLGLELTLSRLENVGGLRDAKSANLKDKTNLKSQDVDTGEIEDNDDDSVNCRDEDTDKNEDKDDDSVIIVAFKVGTLDDISNLVDSMDGILHIGMGDFNAVKSISERAVSQFDANEAMSFSNFIANVRFHDFNRTMLSWTIVPSFCPMLVSISDLSLLGCSTHGSVMRNSALGRSWNSCTGGGVADIRAWWDKKREIRLDGQLRGTKTLFRNLDQADSNVLNNEFTMDEIRKVVWDCAGSKAQRLDALNFIAVMWLSLL
ncbi:disease resistance protein [Tanacetum coccineum]